MKRIGLKGAALAAVILCSLTAQAVAQNVTVSLTSEKQLIRGFGGISLPEWQGSDLTAAQQKTAFGNADGQIGMSILRIWVSDNKSAWSQAVPTAKAAIAAGAIVFATPWYPPSSMRANTGSSTAKYSMNTSAFSSYVTHLNDFVAFMKTNSVDLYAISIQNEPDYASDWTYWSADQVYQFTLNYAGQITTKVISAESFQYKKNLYDLILNDPKALANIDILGAHTYGTQVSAFAYPLADQKAPKLERWMTEHYTESANDADLWPMALDVGTDIHNTMVEGNFSAYVWWFIRRKYSPMKEDGNISKRGYCMAQYSKFIRPGFVRVDATKAPATNVLVSAYYNKTDGKTVVVVVNKNTSASSLKFTIAGTKANSFIKYTTSSSKSLAKDGSVAMSGESFSSSVDGQSVTTFVSEGNSAVQTKTPSALEAITEYKVFDLKGNVLGSVNLSYGEAVQERIGQIVKQPGMFVVKPVGGQASRVILTDFVK
ncbi:MAG: hypothetical protein IPO40_03785 [Fibrobacteres bacterium]|nr:hypothetical protein [Fibrobacterota bacterium]